MKWIWLALLVGCQAPMEVEPSKVTPRHKGCIIDANTPLGCCLVDGQLDCPDVVPPKVRVE